LGMLAGDIETRFGARWRPRDLLILTIKATLTAACFWVHFPLDRA
jgi:hypothetical protein